MTQNTSVARKWIVSGAIALGVAIGAAGIANAVASDKSPKPAASSANSTNPSAKKSISGAGEGHDDDDHDHDGRGEGFGPRGDGPRDGFGPGGLSEVTGATADKVKAAATAKYPGEVERVVQLPDGTYVAHVIGTDGNETHVAVDKDFKVTGVATGPGRGRPGDDPRPDHGDEHGTGHGDGQKTTSAA